MWRLQTATARNKQTLHLWAKMTEKQKTVTFQRLKQQLFVLFYLKSVWPNEWIIRIAGASFSVDWLVVTALYIIDHFVFACPVMSWKTSCTAFVLAPRQTPSTCFQTAERLSPFLLIRESLPVTSAPAERTSNMAQRANLCDVRQRRVLDLQNESVTAKRLKNRFILSCFHNRWKAKSYVEIKCDRLSSPNETYVLQHWSCERGWLW